MAELHPTKPVSGGSGAARVKPALTPERWQKIKEVFSLALERETSERAALMDEACEGAVVGLKPSVGSSNLFQFANFDL